MSLWDPVTEQARQSIVRARDEARRLGGDTVGPEHILLGMIGGKNDAVEFLDTLGVAVTTVRPHFDLIAGNDGGRGRREPVFSPAATTVVDLAFDEARRVGDGCVGTRHLLRGLARYDQSTTAGVLASFGIDPRRVMAQTAWPRGFETPPAQPKSMSKTPTLDAQGRDLTMLARDGKLVPIIGRAHEIDRTIQILTSRSKNNPALIGEPGVGKTAIAAGVAKRVSTGDVPEALRGKRVVALDLERLAGNDDRIERVIDEVRGTDGGVVLVVDKIPAFVGAAGVAIERGDVQCIAMMTFDEFRTSIDNDNALQQRFEPVVIQQASVDETIEILKGLRNRYEDRYEVIIPDETLIAAARLADLHIVNRSLPNKGIDLIDEASSRLRLEVLLQRDRREAGDDLHKPRANKVTEEDVAAIVRAWRRVPVLPVVPNDAAKLISLSEQLREHVVGQESAIDALARAIRRSRAGMTNPKRPIGSFLFLGPVGVGKTEVARALAEFLFDDPKAMVQMDMSDYMEKYSIARLVGPPPGYVGYEEGGQLTEAVRLNPYSVVLLDEIDKAHPDVFNVLLSIFENGRLIDAKRRTIDFTNTVVILTSNVGATVITMMSEPGFRTSYRAFTPAEIHERMTTKVLDEVKHAFRPEFLSRLDEIIVFHQLSTQDIEKIVDLELKKAVRHRRKINLEVTEDARAFLARKGWDPQFGARALRRTIQREIEDVLAEHFLQGTFTSSDRIIADVDPENPDALTFSKTAID